MSQFMISSTAAPPPPAVPTSFVTDSGTAVPVANVLNIATSSSSINTTNGITSTGSGNNVDIILTNRIGGTGTTVGAVTTDIATFALGAVAGAYQFIIQMNGFNSTTPAGVAYLIVAAIRTTGAAGSVVNSVDPLVENEDAALVASDWDVVVVGNSLIVRALGVAGLSINWRVAGIYTFVD